MQYLYFKESWVDNVGLDMYLVDKNHSGMGEDSYIELAYWRKFNSLHRWFLENSQRWVDDCFQYPVSKQQLESLLVVLQADIKRKSTKRKFLDHGLSEDFLGYMSSAINDIQHILDTFNFDTGSIHYYASY